MADDKTDATSEDRRGVSFEILSIYSNNVSLDVPGIPEMFLKRIEASPSLTINMGVGAAKAEPAQADPTYVVSLRFQFKVEHDNRVLMTGDMSYGALVKTAGTGAFLTQILMLDTPTQILPILRAGVMLLTRESGLPPVVPPMMDFGKVLENMRKDKALPDFLV